MQSFYVKVTGKFGDFREISKYSSRSILFGKYAVYFYLKKSPKKLPSLC